MPSFPPHLVRKYLKLFEAGGGSLVLDPFCGTGTVAVECKKLGVSSVSLEAGTMAWFAASVKVDWSPNPVGLQRHAKEIVEVAKSVLAAEGLADAPLGNDQPDQSTDALALRSLPEESMKLLIGGSIAPRALHKTLVLLECLRSYRTDEYYRHELLALARVLVKEISNLRFKSEVGVGKEKKDAAVLAPWLAAVSEIANDLASSIPGADTSALVYQGDARAGFPTLQQGSIDIVITSPPYPNEKDYTRLTRLESVVLGFIQNMTELKAEKRSLMRSNTRNMFVGDDDDAWVADVPAVSAIAESIERKREELGKTSGFERRYGHLTKLYFGGLAKHLSVLRPYLAPGAKLAYVVGDQASYLRVLIPTGEVLADLAKRLGYEVVARDLFRTRRSTTTSQELREEVVLLQWPGSCEDLPRASCTKRARPLTPLASDCSALFGGAGLSIGDHLC